MSQIANQATASPLAAADQTAASTAGRVAETVRNAFGSLIRAYRYRQSIAQLRQMDSRMLADIGIDRSEIVSVVYGDASRKRR